MIFSNQLLVVVGPTGVGKTDLTLTLAKRLNTEIVSSDSRQIYKELTIGTAVPEPWQLKEVPHHFIHTHSIFDYYNASKFEFEVLEKLQELFQQYDHVLMTGGSGLYVDAVCKGIDDLPPVEMDIRNQLWQEFEEQGLAFIRQKLKSLDPAYYKKVDLKNHKRMLKALEVTLQTGKPYSSFLTKPHKNRPFSIVKIGLNRDRAELHERINIRVDKMMETGLLDEARAWYEHKQLNALNTVGYRELFNYFDGKTSLEEAVELIKRNSRRYARKQISWFSRDPEMAWFHPDEEEKIIAHINRYNTNESI
jgi:tRNA dimethylallyltransferase